MTPALALGQAVHAVLESLSVLPVEQRFVQPLLVRFNEEWRKVAGVRGGFRDKEVERRYKSRGEKMLLAVQENPGPLAEKAVKIKQDLPNFWLSEDDDIILCGKIDWLQYIEEDDSVHIIDFKTGKKRAETEDSLQLPIYGLLVHNTQHRKVSGMSYWFLEDEEGLVSQDLPDLDESHEKVLQEAKKVKAARQVGYFECPNGEAGCSACRPFERVLRGEGEYVGEGSYGADIYVLPDDGEDFNIEDNSEIL